MSIVKWLGIVDLNLILKEKHKKEAKNCFLFLFGMEHLISILADLFIKLFFMLLR